MTTLLLFALSLCASAQSLTLSSSLPTIAPGGQVTITVSYLDAVPAAGIAALQFNLNNPPFWVAGPWNAGSALTSAGKSLQCNGTLCIISGLNTTVLTSGVLASILFTVPPNTAAGASQFTITGALGSTAAGSPVSFTGEASAAVQVTGSQPPVTTILAGSAADSQCNKPPVYSYSDPKLPAIYPTLCFGFGVPVHYHIAMPPGLYAGSLVFVEPNKTAAGQRIETVTVNGQTSDPIDIFAMTGGADQILAFPFLALDAVGAVDITINEVIGAPVISAIILNAPITSVAGNAALAGITVAVAVAGH